MSHRVIVTVIGCTVLLQRGAWAADRPAINEVRVYLHYQDPADRALVDEVADVLETLDYRVSDKRLVTQPSTGDVRFFHAPDRTAAVDVKTIVETFLCSRAGGQTLALLDRRERFKHARPGLVEVWIPATGSGRLVRSLQPSAPCMISRNAGEPAADAVR